MQSAEERRRLMSRLGGKLTIPLGAVLRCAAGIVVLVIIAAGPWAFLSASGPTVAATAGEHTRPQAGTALAPTLAEGKRVFDERRERYEAGQQDSALRPEDGMAAAAGPRSE